MTFEKVEAASGGLTTHFQLQSSLFPLLGGKVSANLIQELLDSMLIVQQEMQTVL